MITTEERPPIAEISPKSRLAVVLLAWFLGTLGLHRFYIGSFGSGLVILILSLAGWATVLTLGLSGYLLLVAAGILATIDLAKALLGTLKDGKSRPIKRW